MGNRILIGMLASGENERDQAIAALQAQTYSNYEFFLIENRPNKEAHEALYSRFMSSAGQFDIFLKLDADMVLARATALAEVADFFAANADVGLLLFELIDWYSDSLIPGIVITRNTARWPTHEDRLLVDSYVAITGRHVRVSERHAALAIHSPDPSPLQAFRFGVHRAMKAVQDDRAPDKKILEKAQSHWEILCKTWLNFRVKRDRRLALAIAGAEFVFGNGSEMFGREYAGPAVSKEFEQNWAAQSVDALEMLLSRQWDDTAGNKLRWKQALQAS